MSEKKINWALSLQIGYLVYQYTKLRILQFYYDFLDKFVSREDFQLLEMDTDSLYMALSHERFEDVVRPHLREQFYKEYSRWFPGRACDKHHTDFQMTRLAKQPWNPAQLGQILVLKRTEKSCLLVENHLHFFFISSEWWVLMGFPPFLLQSKSFLLWSSVLWFL